MFFDARDMIIREAQMKDRRNRNAVQAQLKAVKLDPCAAPKHNQQEPSKQTNGPGGTFRRLRLRRNSQPC